MRASQDEAAPFRALNPLDGHNEELRAHAHPPRWTNPVPSGRYDMVVIGGGTAGLVTAVGAAEVGAKVALIERELLGGDCLNTGCVPSKALIRAARARHDVGDAERFGVRIEGPVRQDFAAVMERMRAVRARISRHDSAARLRDLGVDVFLGDAAFTGRDRVQVADRTLRFARACIATGARAAAPPIDGLAEAGYLTNETVFSLTELPARLAVLGAGPIGCELAQAFARFGSEVRLVEMLDRILAREDPDAARLVEEGLRRDGVVPLLATRLLRVGPAAGGKVLDLETPEGNLQVTVDAVLAGVGRAPNVEDLGLDAAGVAFDRAGVRVDDRLRTTNRRIFAAGDVCSPYKFTHAADAMGRIVIRNALFFGRRRAPALTIPWCTYTDPELAHVGLYPREAAERGIAIDTYTVEMASVDRAVLDGEDGGFFAVHCKAGSDRILGATLVARQAGDMISEIGLAMTAGLGLDKIAATIHPYPTRAEAFKKAADACARRRLTPRVRRLLALAGRLRR